MNPIEIRDLVVRYRRGWLKPPVTAVDGLSLDVTQGSVVGFLGPNGAGKSSTLKVLMGFHTADAGTARVFGHPAGSLAARRRIGFLPEVALYYPFLTPREALQMYGRVQGLPERALRTVSGGLLAEVGLEPHADRRLGTFSKGMLQRLGIAQALLGDPDLLILDEVTSGLDPVGRAHLREIMLRRRERGTTIFFSSHELAEVTMLCDRIILVNQGRVVEERDLTELNTSLRRYWLRFQWGHGQERECPFALQAVADDAKGVQVFRCSGVQEGPLPPDLNTRTPEHLNTLPLTAWFDGCEAYLAGLDWLRSNGAEVLDMGQNEGSLEEYFVTKVGGRRS